jgi:hypothetical protein
MADGDNNTALADSEQDTMLGGDPNAGQQMPQDASTLPGGPQGPPNGQSASSGELPGGGMASTNDDDSQGPQVSGRAMFLGNLLKTILTGVTTGIGTANPKSRQAFQAVQQQQQQAQQNQRANQKALDEHQQAQAQTILTNVRIGQIVQQAHNLDTKSQQTILDALYKTGEDDRSNGAIEDEEQIEGKSWIEQYSNAQKRLTDLNKREIASGSPDRWEAISTSKDLNSPSVSLVKKNIHGIVSKEVPKLNEDGDWDGQTYEELKGTQSGLDAINSDRLKKYVGGKTNDQATALNAEARDINSGKKELATVPDADAYIKNTARIIGLKTDKDGNPTGDPSQWLPTKAPYDKNPQLAHDVMDAIQKAQLKLKALNVHEATENQNKLNQARAAAYLRQGVKDEAGKTGATADINFVNDYLAGKNFTGPGDEALLEKYFDLAKPSSGFRMTQSQIELLQKGRSWIEGAKAKAGYIEGGKLFSDQQRQQIADTMKMLAKAKGAGGGNAVPARPSAVPANAVWNPETRQWRLPQ